MQKCFPIHSKQAELHFLKTVLFFASLANALSEMEKTLRALHQVQTAVPSSKKFDTSKYIH